MALRMLRRGQPAMGLFTLLAVSGYFRPAELMSLRQGDLMPPAKQVMRCWTVILFPEERGRASKTQIFDDSVALDDPKLKQFEPIWRAMHCRGSTKPLWAFSYPEYTAVFAQCAQALGVRAVPYQMRHSGPSIDLADEARSLAEAQRRGRWACSSSMARYARSARLAAEWQKVPTRTKVECLHDS